MGRRGSGDLTGLHQLFEAAQVLPGLNLRLFLKELCDEPADTAAGRIVRQRNGYNGSAAVGRPSHSASPVGLSDRKMFTPDSSSL